MDKLELTNELVDSIRRKGVQFKPVPHLDVVAIINPTKMIGAYDANTATPQDIAHEYFHVELKHKRRRFTNDFSNEQERECNYHATLFLWEMFLEQGGTPEYSHHFLKVSGCEEYWLERIVGEPDVFAEPMIAYIQYEQNSGTKKPPVGGWNGDFIMRVMSLFITPKDIETPVTVFHFSEKLEFTVNANVYGEPSELINMDFKFKILNNDDFSLDQHFSSEGMQL